MYKINTISILIIIIKDKRSSVYCIIDDSLKHYIPIIYIIILFYSNSKLVLL